MKSMTGYGKSVVQVNNLDITIEIRSVNNRFLDISLKMPKEFSTFEYEMKNRIKKRLNRGKINIYININEISGKTNEAAIDIDKVKLRYKQLKQIQNELSLKDDIKLENLLIFTDIFDPGIKSIDQKILKKSLLQGLDDALEQFEEMREAEGTNLQKDMEERISKITEWTAFVKNNGRDNIQKEFDRLQNNVYSLIDSSKIDKSRFEQEIAIISDKVDVTEECVRMNSHLQLFNDTLKKEGEAGKKLTFILQEMLREANTMNSKNTKTEIAHIVIRIKEEIEKIREQAQNVE
jgi:uncharacterized protein (TIGR00255 family)